MACNDFGWLSPNFGSSCWSAIARHALLPTFSPLWPFLFYQRDTSSMETTAADEEMAEF
jgi:hypothetical protein